MSFVHPIWLWGLTALLIPLIIHLWSRQKTRILPFGSLRFLQESSSSQSRSIQLTDVGLMLLRMLLFILIVLFIAQFNSIQTIKNEKWLILGDSVQIPNSFTDKDFKIYQINDLRTEDHSLNQWYFLQELSQNHPEIDSLLWIDHFENTDFWGAIPPLSFGFELINKSQSKLSDNAHGNLQDSVFYAFTGLSESQQLIINKILSANEVYLNSKLNFAETEKENTPIVFSNELKEDVPLQFVIEKSDKKSWRTVENWPYKTVYISTKYLTDKRLHDALLLIVSEQIAQYVIPEWNYNDWQQATKLRRKKLDKAVINSAIKPNNEVLFWIIIALFLLERFWVYQKSHE